MFVLLIVAGCKKTLEEKEFNRVIYALNKITRLPWLSPKEKDRANSAISKWQNGTLDIEPILIAATLTKPVGDVEINLTLAIFDEDQDVIGFGIKEEHIRPDGQREVMEETYPAYNHYPLYHVANIWLVPSVYIRTENQRKNEDLWQKYVNGSGEISSLMDVKYYDFPPVWVSVPEPDKVNVWIWVYDKAGNKSEPVRLLNFINK